MSSHRSGAALSFEEVSFSYSPGAPFIGGLSASFEKGKVSCIVGPNGCGKSTLVKLASGFLRPDGGEVRLEGKDVSRLSGNERASLLSVLPQATRIPPLTVESLVGCGRHPYLGLGGRLSADDRVLVEDAMERAGVARFRHHQLRRLSGGERQRAYIAMVLAQGADLIVMDEPTTYLDINACHDLMGLVRDLNRSEGKTVVMVLHDIDLALRYCDYLAVMGKGRMDVCGKPDEVIGAGAIGRAFSMDVYLHERVRKSGERDRAFVLYPSGC